MTKIKHLGGVGFGLVGGFFAYVIGTRLGETRDVNLDGINELDLSGAGMYVCMYVCIGSLRM